jgi:hypothetical protein
MAAVHTEAKIKRGADIMGISLQFVLEQKAYRKNVIYQPRKWWVRTDDDETILEKNTMEIPPSRHVPNSLLSMNRRMVLLATSPNQHKDLDKAIPEPLSFPGSRGFLGHSDRGETGG